MSGPFVGLEGKRIRIKEIRRIGAWKPERKA
jgi:hypothetical protein